MAMTLAGDQTAEPRQTGRGLVLAGDRTAEYRRARFGTMRVRFLRLSLPITAALLLGIYGLEIMRAAGLGASLPEIAIRQLLPEDLAMNNPRYEGFGKDGSSYVFMAKTAQQDLKSPTIIKLNAITGTVVQADKSKTEISAARGTFDHTKSILDLYETIDVASESGLKAKLTRATIITKESILTSPEPVLVEVNAGSIRSDTLTLRQKAREATFAENVVATLTPPPDNSAGHQEAAGSQAAGIFKPTGGPIEITATRLDVSDMTRSAVFTGDVLAKQGDATISTPELEVTYEGKSMLGAGQGEATPAPAADDTEAAQDAQSKLRRIVAKSPVVITRGETERVTSETAEFDAVAQSASLFGNVVMTSGTDRRVVSDRVDLDQKNDTALLLGNVMLTQGQNELKGRRLYIDRAQGRAQLTAPPGLGAGPGRVTARLSRGETNAKPKTTKAPAAANDVASFKTDPNAPVDIEADQLDIDDKAKAAVFRGTVQAAQGDFVIKSAELTAHYKGESGLASAAAPQPSTAKPGEKTEVTRIEAKRNVVITAKDGQTASGDWAEYNAKTSKVTMGGNVILAQGQNMVRGTRLLIDMLTGETKIDTQSSTEPGVAAAPDSGAIPAGGGRASAVFFPHQLKEAQERKSGTTAPPPAADDGWRSTTEPGRAD